MHVNTNLKLGEVNNLSDARFAAGAGAKYVGFCLSPRHPQYAEPNKVKEILGWIEGIKPVAEWENEPTEVISDTCQRLGIEYVQLNHCDSDCSMALKDFILIQNFYLDVEDTSGLINRLDHVQRYTRYYMLSFRDAAMQEQYLKIPAHQQMIKELCRDFPVFLNFHFTPANLVPCIEAYSPFGINLKGGPEDKPGYKDFDQLNELVDLLQA
jgi:phosphoribosylanthranilate isomerase